MLEIFQNVAKIAGRAEALEFARWIPKFRVQALEETQAAHRQITTTIIAD